LRGVDVHLPAEGLVAVTGVSGSGKSSLVMDVVAASLQKGRPIGCTSLSGGHGFKKVLTLGDRAHLPGPCVAGALGVFKELRTLFAATDTAKARGYTASHFSFLSPKGACEGCGGAGVEKVPMAFMDNASVPCELCGGSGYRAEVLEPTLWGLDISRLLATPIDTAAQLFAESAEKTRKPHRAIFRALTTATDLGLGYLTLGQRIPTLSHGESQRLKLFRELLGAHGDEEGPSGDHRKGHREGTLFLLDEPTTGLHRRDIHRLLEVFRRLLDLGDTVVVIEHNLEMIRQAHWVLDLGPGAADEGGRLVAASTPQDLMKKRASATGEALKRYATRLSRR